MLPVARSALDHKLIRSLDVALGVWTALWIALAWASAHEILSLRQLSSTIGQSSDVLAETADVLSGIKDIPLVGDRVRDVEASVRTAADGTKESARQTRDNIEDVSLIVAIVVVVVPVLPVAALYLPLRMAWRQDRARTRAILDSTPDADERELLLAMRALQTTGIVDLREMGVALPFDLSDEQRTKLASAEADRLGIRGTTPAP